MVLAVDTKSPITDPEREAGIGQGTRIALQILLHAFAAKSRPLGEDLGAGAAAEPADTQHLLPGGHRLLKDRGIDLTVQDVVGASIVIVGDPALAVPQVLRQGEQRRAIAKRGEPDERLAALVARRVARACRCTGARLNQDIERLSSNPISPVVSTRTALLS